ncbi:MAG TPA: Fur family transcriptional regulator [Chthonomonadales bacterium]|nr:Fur family transcriptional regulator [Chthonomonadales bacterium]
MQDTVALLRSAGLTPTPQRIAIARYIFDLGDHPTADEVLAAVRREHSTISRATVYNTLHALADKGLVRSRMLREGAAVIDARPEAHHHLIDEASGKIFDIPWDALKVAGVSELNDFDIWEYQVVLRGRKRQG